MSKLEKEIQALKKEWKNSSAIAKVFIGVGVFFTVSSITSLSEEIFKWKGFILDGVNFYREWVRNPITDFLARFNFRIHDNLKDAFVITAILGGTMVKYYIIYFRTKLKIKIWESIFLHFAILALYFVSLYSYALWDYLTMMFMVVVWAGMIIYETINIRKDKGALISLYAPLILAIVFVFVLGAMNSGLTR